MAVEADAYAAVDPMGGALGSAVTGLSIEGWWLLVVGCGLSMWM